jgi:hypothetical protein
MATGIAGRHKACPRAESAVDPCSQRGAASPELEGSRSKRHNQRSQVSPEAIGFLLQAREMELGSLRDVALAEVRKCAADCRLLRSKGIDEARRSQPEFVWAISASGRVCRVSGGTLIGGAAAGYLCTRPDADRSRNFVYVALYQ